MRRPNALHIAGLVALVLGALPCAAGAQAFVPPPTPVRVRVTAVDTTGGPARFGFAQRCSPTAAWTVVPMEFGAPRLLMMGDSIAAFQIQASDTTRLMVVEVTDNRQPNRVLWRGTGATLTLRRAAIGDWRTDSTTQVPWRRPNER